MRYALISDIHGNLHALQSVLEDAKQRKVDYYLLLGDYYLSCAYPNEVVDVIRELPNAIVISGNEELHIKNLFNQNQSKWTDGQMQALYHSFNALSNENKEYLMNLPNENTINDRNFTITVFHDFGKYFNFNDVRENRVSSVNMSIMLNENNYTSYQAINVSKEKLLTNNQLKESLANYPDGVYVFGHNHLQYHLDLNGKLLINPGSCGLPLDGIKGAPYSIIDISNNKLKVEEYRVEYDIDKAIIAIQSSSMYLSAKVWHDIIIMELNSGTEKVSFFLDYTRKYAESIGDTTRPYSLNTWESAYSKWMGDKYHK